MAPTSSSKAKKVHFESNDPPSFPEDFDPKAFAKLKVANLQSRLKKSEIAYGTRDTKPELQALVLLSVMEIVGLKKKVDEKLLEKVSGWCRGLVGDLHDEIEGRGLEKGANRWLCIEVLVQDEIATPKEEKPKKKKAKAASTANGKRKAKEVESDDEPSEESTKKTKRNGKGKVAAAVDEENDVAETSNDANTNTDATSTHPSPEVMNLLISTIFVDLAKGNATLEDSLPGCSHDTKDKVVELLNDTAAFASQAQLSKVLDEPTSEADKLVAWIASTYGRDIILAEGDLKIPGFSGAVKQFVIAKPRLNLEKSWKTLFTKARKTSMLLFHGTSYVHLQSILRTGFYPSQDKSRGTGVFLGVEPSTSYDYATSESRGYSVDRAGRSAADEPVKYGGRWKYDPYQNRPLLFGCEATGQGREQPGGAFHVVTGLKSVIARYIFLLGPPAAVGYPYYPRAGDIAPLRATVEPAMVAAFGKIRAGLDEEEQNETSSGERSITDFNPMNLILSSLFWDVNIYGTFPNSPFDKQKILDNLANILTFESQQELLNTLNDKSGPSYRLLTWINRKSRDSIILATGELKIPEFHESIQQFVLVKPGLERQALWRQHYQQDSEKSILLFHVTGLLAFDLTKRFLGSS